MGGLTVRKTTTPAASQSILVVEDEVLIRMAVAQYLRTCGYEVIEAGHAAEAIEVLTSGTQVDLVFSDVQMPGDMDGFGLATWVKQNYPAVKVILSSGVAKTAEKAGDLCAQGPMLRKPYGEGELVRLIRKLLPAGMRGVGAIYRLYRRGALLSDDEVILVYSSDGSGYQPRSVPLINVRYALSRALRKGLLERPAAERIVASAQRLHFSERCWPVILANAGALDPHGELQTLVSSLDLKREDTVRCLHTVARWLAETPALAERPRRLSTAFIPSEARRQRDYDALAGLDREEVKRDLSRWQLISGRYGRHLLRIAAVDPEIGLAARLKRKGALAALLADLARRRHNENESIGDAENQANVRTAALMLVLEESWKALAADQHGFAEALWAELTASGELDAEIFRWRAVRDAARVARSRGLSTRVRDQSLAESEIAHAHGFHSWQDLQQASTLAPFPWSDFVAYRDELALAKRLRQDLFNPRPFELK